ncbi:helix-turn-helix domain-containing protein [Bacillus sp. DJP31]|uniref:helix-turn-helix domain-containing protein n=1 Tax=Bacillus sp. DJP31 TaxID=3409789 RepID=UPI003BB4B860
MIKQEFEIQQIVLDLEYVLNDIKDISHSIRLKKAIQLLNSAITIQVGDNKITFLSNETIVPISDLPEDVQDNKEKYVDTKTVAEYYGVTSETVRNWIRDKIISGHQMGPRGKFMIPQKEFEFLKEKMNQKEETKAIMKDFLNEDYTEDWEIEIDE